MLRSVRFWRYWQLDELFRGDMQTMELALNEITLQSTTGSGACEETAEAERKSVQLTSDIPKLTMFQGKPATSWGYPALRKWELATPRLGEPPNYRSDAQKTGSRNFCKVY